MQCFSYSFDHKNWPGFICSREIVIKLWHRIYRLIMYMNTNRSGQSTCSAYHAVPSFHTIALLPIIVFLSSHWVMILWTQHFRCDFLPFWFLVLDFKLTLNWFNYQMIRKQKYLHKLFHRNHDQEVRLSYHIHT